MVVRHFFNEDIFATSKTCDVRAKGHKKLWIGVSTVGSCVVQIYYKTALRKSSINLHYANNLPCIVYFEKTSLMQVLYYVGTCAIYQVYALYNKFFIEIYTEEAWDFLKAWGPSK